MTFDVNPSLTTATAALILVVGSTRLDPADGNVDLQNGNIRWSSSGVSLTVGTAVSVSLVSGTVSTNNAPTVANPIQDQTATVGTALNFAFPTNTFADTDAGDTLTYTATQSDDSALPSWLSFAAATRTFSGTPTAADGDSLGKGDGERRQWRLGQRHLRYRGLGGRQQRADVFADATRGRSRTRTPTTPGRRGDFTFDGHGMRGDSRGERQDRDADGIGDTLTLHALEGTDDGEVRGIVCQQTVQIADEGGRPEIRPGGQGELFGDGEGATTFANGGFKVTRSARDDQR